MGGESGAEDGELNFNFTTALARGEKWARVVRPSSPQFAPSRVILRPSTSHDGRVGRHDGGDGFGRTRPGQSLGVPTLPRSAGEGEHFRQMVRELAKRSRGGKELRELGGADGMDADCFPGRGQDWDGLGRRGSYAARHCTWGGLSLSRSCGTGAGDSEPSQRAEELTARASSGDPTTPRRRRQHSLPDADWRRKVSLLPGPCDRAFSRSPSPCSR